MGKSRAERREACGELTNLFQKGTLVGARVIRQVPMALALEKVAQRKWRRVFYEGGDLAGFQPYPEPQLQKPRSTRVGASLDGSAATITVTESRMNAGEFGESRTAGLPEKRVKRIADGKVCRIFGPQDSIELAIEKVKLWPYPASRIDDGSGKAVFGDKAVRVYPHPPAK